jgi:hypothetical protein
MSSPPGLKPDQRHAPGGAVHALTALLQSKALLVYEAVDSRLNRLSAAVASHLRTLARAVNRVLVKLAALPGVLYRRAVRTARTIVDVLYFLFVIVPRWLVFELPKRVLAALRTFARAVKAFLTGEVVPTAEFFVEVPPALLGATLRDLFLRTPLWVVVRGPTVFSDLAKAAFSQLALIVVAMFDRARGLVDRLIDGAFFVWDTIQGGLRWIVVSLFIQLAPWLMHLGFEAFDHLILFANAVVLFVIAARRWLWHTIVELPHYVAELIRAVAQAIQTAANYVLEWLTWLVRALPVMAEGIIRGFAEFMQFLFIQIPMNIARALRDLTVNVLRLLFIELPRTLWDLIYGTFMVLWELGDALVQLAIKLPNYAWQLAVYLFVTLPREIGRGIMNLLRSLWNAMAEIMRTLGRPIMTILTWTLALAISPFYFMARLLGLGGSNRLSGRGR